MSIKQKKRKAEIGAVDSLFFQHTRKKYICRQGRLIKFLKIRMQKLSCSLPTNENEKKSQIRTPHGHLCACILK